MGKQTKGIVDSYSEIMDMDFINSIIEKEGTIKDFEMNKTTLMNVADWALNGSSDEEIRKKLDLSPTQWKVLVNICPTLLLVMRESRALADVIIAGSLFQTAIGGKKIAREVAKTVTEYDERGKACGSHLEKITLYEELPPNADLLKFLATHKLSEKFGDKQIDTSDRYKDILARFTPEQLALIESMKKGIDDEKD